MWRAFGVSNIICGVLWNDFALTFQIVLLLALVLMHLVVIGASGPRPLSMGVRAAKGDQVYLKSAEWRVLVSMEVPSSDVDQQLDALNVRIQDSQLPGNFKVAFAVRLDNLKSRPVNFRWRSTEGLTRRKRGILNFVGEIGQQLFGLATEKEVEELRLYIQKSQQSQEALYIDIQNLVAVVNDSVSAINVNSRNIQRLQTSLVRAVEGTTLRLTIHEAIGDLERAAYHRDRQEDRWARARATLEQFTLTEEIFLPDYLRQILRGEGTKLPLEWYY
jgi:hypothetical protein